MQQAEPTEGQSSYEEESLPARIERAFGDTPYPGDGRLVPDRSHWEAGKIARVFAGQDWKTMPLDALSPHQASLSYFTPEAYRYYLPAYLLAAVRRLSQTEANTSAANIPEALAYTLTPPRQEGFGSDQFRARMSGLTAEQKTVIRDYLRWVDQTAREWEQTHLPTQAKQNEEEDKEEVALKEYWENIK